MLPGVRRAPLAYPPLAAMSGVVPFVVRDGVSDGDSRSLLMAGVWLLTQVEAV